MVDTLTQVRKLSLTVAFERAIYVVILCFFSLGSATTCRYDSECDQFSGESCCSNSVCRKTCFYCSSNYDCVTDEECCDGGDCSTFCSSSDSSSLTEASTAGAIVGTMVFFAISREFTKPRRRRQRERLQTKGLMS